VEIAEMSGSKEMIKMKPAKAPVDAAKATPMKQSSSAAAIPHANSSPGPLSLPPLPPIEDFIPLSIISS